MLKTEKINDIIIVRFDKIDRLNALIAEPVKEDLKSFFSRSGVKLVLNLDNIKFIDSTGFGVFLSIMKTANNNHGQFKICNINQGVMDLFKLLQLHNIFELYNTLEECLKSFK